MAKPNRFWGATLHRAREYKVPRHLVDRVIQAFLEGINTPRSLAAWMLYKSGEHQQLASLSVDPATYLCGGAKVLLGFKGTLDSIHPFISKRDEFQFRDDYLATCFLSKYEGLKVDVDPKQAAVSKWFEVEDQMKAVNANLAKWIDCIAGNDADFITSNAEFVHILSRMRDKIHDTLGQFDPTEWFELSSWGPGSTQMINGLDTSAVTKYRREAGATHKFASLLQDLLPAYSPLWANSLFERGIKLFSGNKFCTVPKNALTERAIAVEPGLNVYFQLGLGRMIGRRLLRYEGIDLEDQGRNGLLCFYGSLSGELATVDFSSASDRISYLLVRYLLPREWFRVLDLLRSPCSRVALEGSKSEIEVRLEKFSSMGNGFTFPLQSLIFHALACAVIDEHNSVMQFPRGKGVGSEYVGVFGDDVVLPKDVYGTFTRMAERIGFKVNLQKSFSEGYFRESCGTHYLRGLDVKPIYLKERLDDVQSVYKLANAIRGLAHRRAFGHGCDSRLRSAWVLLYGAVPKDLRFHIADGYGDGGFVDNFDASCPEPFRPKPASGKHPWCEGWLVRHLTEQPVTHVARHVGYLLNKLRVPWSQYIRDTWGRPLWRWWDQVFIRPAGNSRILDKNSYPLRDATESTISVLWIHEWRELGPWV